MKFLRLRVDDERGAKSSLQLVIRGRLRVPGYTATSSRPWVLDPAAFLVSKEVCAWKLKEVLVDLLNAHSCI